MTCLAKGRWQRSRLETTGQLTEGHGFRKEDGEVMPFSLLLVPREAAVGTSERRCVHTLRAL